MQRRGSAETCKRHLRYTLCLIEVVLLWQAAAGSFPQPVRPKRWKPIVERMVWRMRGNGNIGDVMKDMMAQVRTPAGTEVQTKSIACAALR
jgi:hypothetical protein